MPAPSYHIEHRGWWRSVAGRRPGGAHEVARLHGEIQMNDEVALDGWNGPISSRGGLARVGLARLRYAIEDELEAPLAALPRERR